MPVCTCAWLTLSCAKIRRGYFRTSGRESEKVCSLFFCPTLRGGDFFGTPNKANVWRVLMDLFHLSMLACKLRTFAAKWQAWWWLGIFKRPENCLRICTLVTKAGVEQLHHWAPYLFTCAEYCAKHSYLRHSRRIEPRDDCHYVPCSKTLLKRIFLFECGYGFCFIKAMSGYGSWLLLSCKAAGTTRLLRVHFGFIFDALARCFNQWKMTKMTKNGLCLNQWKMTKSDWIFFCVASQIDREQFIAGKLQYNRPF